MPLHWLDDTAKITSKTVSIRRRIDVEGEVYARRRPPHVGASGRPRDLVCCSTCYTGPNKSRRHHNGDNGDECGFRPYARGRWEVNIALRNQSGACSRSSERGDVRSRSGRRSYETVRERGGRHVHLSRSSSPSGLRRASVDTVVESSRW